MRKDGVLVDVEVLIVPLQMDGERIGSYAIYHDVSELHRQKLYFESLLEISPTAIITVGLDSRITCWNPAAEKLFGYRRDEAVGRLVDELIAAAEEVRAEAAEVNRLGSQGEVELITRRTRKDGSLVDVHLLVAPVFLEGELVGRYGIYHDISELQRQSDTIRAQAEELARWNRTLNARVDEQVEEIERMSRLRRFLSPQIADASVEDVVEAEPAGELELKGFRGPQRVFNLIGLKSQDADVEPVREPHSERQSS